MASKHTHIIETKAVGTKKAESSIKSLKKSVAGLASAYLGATGLISVVKNSIDAFSQQEIAEKKLSQAFKGSTSALLAQASAMQKVTVFGDEAIIMQQAFLASIGMSEKQIKKILPVAADLASATGMTLESAVRNTAKTFSGLAGELGELVPQLRDLTPEAMKAGQAVEVMSELFGGAAEAEADTFSGSMQQLQNIMGDMGEQIGSTFAPAIMAVVDGFKDLMEVNASDVLREERQEFNTLLDILKDVNSATSTRDKAIKKLNDKYGDYIGNLDLEKAKLEEIQELQAASAKEFEQKIIDKQFEEELTEAITRRIEQEKRLFDLKIKDGEQLSTISRTYNDQAILDAQQKIKDILEEENAIRVRQDAFREQVEETVELDKKVTKSNQTKNKVEKIGIDQLKEKLERGLKQLTFEKDAAKISAGIGKTAIKLGNMNAMEEWQTTLSMALVNAAASIIKASKKGGFKGGLLMAAQVAPQVSAIYANKPESAQTGFEGVVDEPTQFTVGEGGAAEYVSVTPMEGVNNAGGQGININISGNVMSEQFVEEELAERIQEAVRKGVNFGIV